MRHTIMVLCTAVLLAAGPAYSQTLGITVGGLFPVGDFSNQVDASPYIGARCEIQDVNDPFGQLASLNVLFQVGFAFLQTDSALSSPTSARSGDNGSYFDVGVGLRAYAKPSPFFLGVGTSYLNVDAPGGAGSKSGFGAHIELGVALDQTTYQLEIGSRATLGIFEKDNIANIQLLAGLGIPF